MVRTIFGWLLVASLAGCASAVPADAGVADAARADVPRDDGYPSVCGMTLGACNWVTNEGCSGANGCYRANVDGGVRQLCAAAGNGGWGAPCTTANACRQGFVCLGEPGRCTMLCCGADHARCGDPGAGGRVGALCVGAVLGTDTRYCLAVEPCDPLATGANGCPNDRPRCDVIAATGATACLPVRENAGGEDAPCCRSESCQPGYACIREVTRACSEATPTGACRRFCDPTRDGGAVCPSGQGCGTRFEGLPPNIGACAPR